MEVLDDKSDDIFMMSSLPLKKIKQQDTSTMYNTTETEQTMKTCNLHVPVCTCTCICLTDVWGQFCSEQ